MEYPKLKNQPLTAVLAEFRFSPVLQISEKIPQIQERLRSQYPGFIQRLSAQILLGSSAPVQPSQIPTAWIFTSASKRQSVFLEPNRVIYTSADYDRFPGFRDACEAILDVVSAVASPGTLDRVGLRYNDAIDPKSTRQLSDYLIPEVLPARPMLASGEQLISHQYTTAIRTSVGIMQIRALIGRTGLPMMPDMLMIFPTPIADPLPVEYDTAILDFDHFWEGQDKTFSVDGAVDQLAKLHDRAREAFWSITTSKAKSDYWR